MGAAPGWTHRDALWEFWQESACHAWLHGHHRRARWLWRLACGLALLCFRRHDPRLAASLASIALLARLGGRESAAQKHLTAALKIWAQTPQWIEKMHISRRARMSLHHLRLELRNWPVYEDNLRRRMSRFAAETEDSLRALQAGATLPHRHFSRWRGEKPPLRDDCRRLLAACLLLADTPVQTSSPPDPGKKS